MPSFTAEQSRLITVSVALLATVTIAAALSYTRDIMVPFVLAVFVSYLVTPLVDLLQDRLRLPRLIGVFVALVVALGLIVLLVLLISTSVRGLLASADVYQQKLSDFVARAATLLDRFGVDLGQRNVSEAVKQLPLARLARQTLGTVVNLVTKAGLITLFVIYLVAARRPTERSEMSAEIDTKVRRYLATKVATSAATGLLVGTILWMFGLDLALVFGITAFLLNFVPSIGSVVATLLPLPVALVQFDSLWPIVGVIALPGAVQMAIGNGVEPLVMGEGLDLHPITILLALMFWGLLWGVPGMLMAAPITAVLRLVLAKLAITAPVGEMLAGRWPHGAAATRPA
ncbi:MAG: AI-2E family transporter [Gemmatimonadota bacterium]|nr:AI-2E family transporter [Gemmatimonadota bacterium]